MYVYGFIIIFFTLCWSFVNSSNPFIVNKKVSSQILEYLEWIDSIKPLKCDEGPLSNFVEDQDHAIWFKSQRCTLESEEWSPFYYKGAYDEEGRLFGPGKLRRESKGKKSLEYNLSTRTCLTFPYFSTHTDEIRSLTGNFRNGTIHGVAKIVFQSGETHILKFNVGIPHGFHRIFNPQGKLIIAQMMVNGIPLGSYWKRVGRDQFVHGFHHKNKIPLSSNRINHTLVFHIPSSGFLAGSYPKYIQYIYNPYKPKDIEWNQGNSNACIQSPQFEDTEAQTYQIYSIDFANFISEIPLPPFFSPASTLSPSEKLVMFRKYLNRNGTFYIQKMRAERRESSQVEEQVPFLSHIVRKHGTFHGIILGNHNFSFLHHHGACDKNGYFHGPTWLRLIKKEITPINKIFNSTIDFLALQFTHGQIMDGIIIMVLSDGRNVFMNILSKTLQGLSFIEGSVPILPLKHIKDPYICKESSTLLHYENGRNTGPFWIGMLGHGVLTGSLNESGYVSGENIAYLYPDMETSYIGKFEDKIMKEAYLGDVSDVSFDSGPIPLLKFKMSSEMEGAPFYYEPPTNGSIGAGPYVLDPYDQKRVYLSDAGEFGEGVHVKKDMAMGEVACLYNYHIYYPEDQAFYSKSCTQNLTKSDDERRHCLKYALTSRYMKAIWNIPPEKDVSGMFLPTLGMKLNHKFYDSHASFLDFESPRWGLINSIKLNYKGISSGEELYVDYGYKEKNKFPADFPWYWETKKRIDSERKKKLKSKLDMKKTKKNGKKKKKSEKHTT